MEQADEELRETIQKIWPLQAKKMLDLLIPRKDGNIMLKMDRNAQVFLLIRFIDRIYFYCIKYIFRAWQKQNDSGQGVCFIAHH